MACRFREPSLLVKQTQRKLNRKIFPLQFHWITSFTRLGGPQVRLGRTTERKGKMGKEGGEEETTHTGEVERKKSIKFGAKFNGDRK